MEDLKKSFLVRGDNIIGALGDKYFSTAPLGTVQAFSGQTAPHGYLLCDGASYKVADYPHLYAVIGNTYGGDSTNFNVPDYRETVLVGVGENTTDTITEHDVYELGEFKDDQLQTHIHKVKWHATSNSGSTSWVGNGGGNYPEDSYEPTSPARIGTTTHGKQKGVTYIIKAFHTNEGVDSGVSDDVVEYVEGKINDSEIQTNTTWSSSKINEELEDVRGELDIIVEEANKNTTINDELVSLTTTWSSKKTSEEITKITDGTIKINADTVDGWHIYSGLSEIGLSGSVTMTDVIAAMPNKSELRFTNNTDNPNSVSDVPDKYGFLTIKKNLYVEATWIAVNRKTTVPMYFGSWHNDNGWTGWSSSETNHLSNSNYLDNSDFKINQRGLTTYSSATDAIFCMDRWLINPNMTITYSDTGSVLVTQSADQKQHFRQYLSDPKRFAGKTVTLSIGTTTTEGDIRLAIYDSPATMTEGTWKYADKNVFTVNIENGIRAVSIIPTTLGSTVEVQWVKLEIGSAATIYSPPDYAEELLRIQTMTDDGYSRLITNDTMPIIVNSQMISNPNLLDNPDFSINQRGLTQYEVASKTYTVDRWKTPNVPSLIIPGDKQITIQRHSSATSKFSGLGQVVEKLVKGVYTFSVDIVSADATVPTITIRAIDWADIANNVSGTYYGIKSITNSADMIGRHSITFELPEDKENVYLYVYASNIEAEDAKFTIANAKLEAGKVATPFVAPHPATELVKCQRYYQRLNTKRERMWSYNANQLTFFLEYPKMLRPTATIVGTPAISNLNGNIEEGFTFSIGWCDYTGLRLDAVKNTHGMTDGVLTINSSSGSYIELNAEL